jgi:hypothetical protein
LLILPAGWAVSSCSTDSVKGDIPGPTTSADGGLRFISDRTGTHEHEFTIPTDDLAQPPGAGLTGPTTTSLGHYHLVRLTEAELAQIQAGGTVFKTTSIIDGHLHNYKFSMMTSEEADGSAPD